MVLLCGAALGIPAYFGAFRAYLLYQATIGASHRIEQKQRTLLYATDHQKLLEACDEIRANWKKYKHDVSWSGAPNDFSHPDPADPAFPAIVRALKPLYITVTDGDVSIEMGGGFYHYGVIAPKTSRPCMKTKELVPGLWYYAEDGKVPPKE